MAKKCKSCGAPLDISSNEEYIKCSFCGTTNSNHGFMHFFNNLFSGAKNIPVDVDIKHKTITKQTSKGVKVFILATIFIPMLAVAIVLTNTFLWGKPDWHSKCQLIGYNQDGIADIVGFTKRHINTQILTILDGATGDVLARRDIDEKGSFMKLYCAGKKHIITVGNEVLTVYNTKGLADKFSFDVPNSIDGFKYKDNVLCVRATFGGEVYGFNLVNGQECDCSKEGNYVKPEAQNSDKKYTDPQTGIEYGSDYNFKTKTTIKATKGSKELWKTRFEDIELVHNSTIVDGKDNIIVFGRKKNDLKHTFIIGIDKKTGKEKYRVKDGGVHNYFEEAFFNNKYLVVRWMKGLKAYHPGTGNEVWSY